MGIVIIGVGICFLIVSAYWVWFFVAFSKTQPPIYSPENLTQGVSVIVCYKNAEGHILKTIENILRQDYPNFEVIAINDFSTDQGPDLLKKLADQRLRLMDAKQDKPGKKAALSEAIAMSSHDILLFTDADCSPASDRWIGWMATCMVSKTEIVLGYGPLTRQNGWMNDFAKYETILTAMQYVTYARTGIPYMGVGRNLMYRKSLFDRVDGFSSHDNIASGDDDLLIMAAATSTNTAVQICRESFVYSDAPLSLRSFLNQKKRHISTSVRYQPIHQMLLGLFAMAQTGFFLLLAGGWFTGLLSLSVVLSFLAAKWIVQMNLHHKIFRKLDGCHLVLKFPLLDICMTLYYLVLPVYSLFARRRSW
ncbi:MAG: glycosyltransferase [Saprospiraceae bacterium]|nr:glycosyltransferase [Saprospiraceae bacterium]